MERFLHYLVIVCFACGVVALGASELQHRYRGRSGAGARILIKELRGDLDAGRASLRRDEPSGGGKIRLKEDQGVYEPSSDDTSKWQVGGGTAAGGTNKGESSVVNKGTDESTMKATVKGPIKGTDKLDSDDRQELNSMLDRILP